MAIFSQKGMARRCTQANPKRRAKAQPITRAALVPDATAASNPKAGPAKANQRHGDLPVKVNAKLIKPNVTAHVAKCMGLNSGAEARGCPSSRPLSPTSPAKADAARQRRAKCLSVNCTLPSGAIASARMGIKAKGKKSPIDATLGSPGCKRKAIANSRKPDHDAQSTGELRKITQNDCRQPKTKAGTANNIEIYAA